WAVRAAAEQVGRWQGIPGHEDLRVAVNVSARQVHDASFPEVVGELRDESLLRPGSLWLEITESVLLDDVVVAGERLEELAALGAHLALDDFGTGYSSLTYLRRLPVDS